MYRDTYARALWFGILLAASLLSCPSITVPTGTVNIHHVLWPVLFLAFILNGIAVKNTHHPRHFSNSLA